MAKKKKKKSKADARGYATQATKAANQKVAGSAVRKVDVTSKAHEGLTNLLGDLTSSPDASEVKDEGLTLAKNEKSVSVSNPSTRTANIPVSWKNDDNLSGNLDRESTKFLKKVTNVHDKLLDLDFSEEKIEEVMKEMSLRGLDLSMETALDWLCLNMPTEQLPPLFGEATIRISALGGEGEISVVKQERPSTAAPGEKDEQAAAELSSTLTNLALKSRVSRDESPRDSSDLDDETGKESKESRARLLQQYQYVEESDDESNKEAPEAEEEGDMGSDVECLVTPQERQLAELEKQIEEDRSSLNDDAANYMRSKHEIAELKKRLKKAEGQARGLRSKVAKIRSARERETAQTTEAPQGEADEHGRSDDCEEGGYGLSLFDNESALNDEAKERVSDEKKVSSAPPEAKTVMEGTSSRLLGIDSSGPSIPKGWTGKTPKKILEEWCQKRKLPKPQYQKMPGPGHACRLVVHKEPQQPQTKRGKKKAQDSPSEVLSIEEQGPFNSFADAQHFLSTEALYDLNPTLPLYRIFPPVFRDLWKGWVDAIVAEKEAEVKSRQQSKEDKMRSLARSLPAKASLLISSNDGPAGLAKSVQSEISTAEPDVPESWDDDSANEENERSSTPVLAGEPTILGKRTKEEFSRQQTSKRYVQMANERSALPMSSYRQELLDTVKSHQVTVLCAQTGAGKTTQCPQFLLEDAILSGHGDAVNIICTQPRRISAISVAERVADEMCERIGEKIGYHIRGETRRSKTTKLMFCTTGVVLRRLQDDPNLAGVTHVVVDEVHERQWQIDFLLIVIRQLIRTTRKDLKVILMSATLDSQLFCSFFHGAPFLSVPGRTFPVSEYYLEDLLDATDHIIEEDSRCAMRNKSDRGNYASLWVTGRGGEKRRQVVSMEAEKGFADVSDDYVGYTMATRRSMDRVDEEIINYDLIEDVLSILLIDPKDGQLAMPAGLDIGQSIENAAVLVFLPGLGEIRTLSERLKGSYKFGSRQKFDIIPMHSTLPPKDQRRAFAKPQSGCRKIILATNICETSITIPDVAFVIDTGQVREVRTNKRTGTSTLVTDWCSKASAKQRSGRAGRVQAGICCKLYSSKTANRVMKDQAMPELQRVPLEEVCLSILAANMSSNCMDFLLQAPQPPEEEAVQNALALLTEVGAIHEPSPTSLVKIERLTPLGQHLAKLPVHVRLGKMLIFGALFQCLDKVLTIVASLSCSKSVFAASFDDAQQSAAHKSFLHPTSDFLSICNVWDKYSAEMKESASRGRRFCDKYYLSRSALMEISDLRRQFLSLLEQLGFIHGCYVGRFSDGENRNGFDLKEYNTNGNKENIVSAVICAGLYPNLAHAVKATGSGVPELWHGTERLHFHSSSVNHKKTALDSEWVVFYEKFATSRVYISATSLVQPFSILLFGRSLMVKHLDRKVVVDDWIELNIAAQTGVMFSNLREEVDVLLKEMIQNPDDKHEKGNRMIRGIVNLLASEL